MSDLAVDTSALIALTFGEAESDLVEAALTSAANRYISAATVVELGIVLGGRTSPPITAADVITAARLTVVPLDDRDAELALEGWSRFGRGRHPARLNLGDCYSYALARRRNLPLLAIGNDFIHTDATVLPQR